MVVIKDVKFLISEDKGRQTAEENWEAIKLVNPQASSRVTLVAACKASWEDGIECSVHFASHQSYLKPRIGGDIYLIKCIIKYI